MSYGFNQPKDSIDLLPRLLATSSKCENAYYGVRKRQHRRYNQREFEPYGGHEKGPVVSYERLVDVGAAMPVA